MDSTPTIPPGCSPPEPLATAAELLEALPWGVLVLDAQEVIRHVNPQAAQWCGAPAEALLGLPLTQAPLPPALGTALRQLREPGAAPLKVWLPPTQQWLHLCAAPAPAGQHWVFLEDTTARHQAEAARQRSSRLLLDMEAVAHTGSYEADLVSGSFYFSDGLYRLFGEAPQAFEVTLAAIDARSHPADVATVRQVLDEAVRTRQPYTYRRRIRRADGAWRTLEAHGEVVCDVAGQAVQLRGLVQDVTERVQAEQALHASHELLQRTIDSSLDMVQVFEAVRDEQGAVVDFTWVLNNAAAEHYYGNVIGQRLRQLNPGVVEAGIFDTFRQVLETGVPDQREHHYVHEQFDGWFHQSTVKLGDGVTTTTHDISARKRAEQELRETKELLQATLDSSHHVVQAFKAVRDADGKIVDFTWLLTNQVWEKQYGGPMAGKSLLQENPGVVETGLFEKFVQVTETGVPVDHEQYYAHEQFDTWFHQTLVRMGDGFVMNTIEITERKQAQAEVISLKEQLAQQAQDRYHSLFYTMEEGVSILEMLYDDHGQPVDMRWVEVNPAFERITGLNDVAGKRTSTVAPTEQYWLNAYDSVVKTGKALRYDNYHAGVQQWYRTHTSRIGGPESRIVANVFEDITEHKRHEAQLRQAAEAETFRLRLTDALGPLADAVAIQEAATRLARQHFGADRCYYCEVIDGQVVIQRDVAAEGLPSVAGTYPLANFAVLKAGHPLVVRDVRQEESVDDNLRQLCVQRQVISYLDVPVIKNGEPVGVLCLVQSTPREWTAAETALAAEVAERAWAAVERARTEAALRASEERFRAVANLGPDLLWRSSPDNATTWYNQRWYEYTGQTLEEAAGDGWKNVVHPDDQVESSRRYQAAVAAGQPLRLEHRFRSAQGEYRWFQVRARPLLDAHGEVTAWFGAATDIHARKLAELRQQFLLRLSDALRPLSDPLEIQRASMRVLGEWLQVDRVLYADITPDGETWTVQANYTSGKLPALLGSFPTAAFGASVNVLKRGEDVVIPDVEEATELTKEEKDLYEAYRTRSVIGVPLFKEGRWLSNIGIHHAEPRRWSRAEIVLVEETAERTWAAVERARAEAALRESEEKYRTLFDSLDEGVTTLEIIFDDHQRMVDARYLESNPACYTLTGLSPDILGKRFSEVVPHLEQFWFDTYEHVVKTGQPARVEHTVAEINRWFDIHISRVGGTGSRTLVVVYTNITERKRREANLAFLAEASQDLLRLTDLDATMNTLGQKLAAYLGLAACVFAELSADAQVGVIRHGWHRADMPSFLGTYRMAEFVSAEVLRRCQAGETVIIRDVWADPLTDGAQYTALRIGSFVSIPLVRDGAWRFLLVVYRSDPHDWSADEIDLLQEIAARIWARLERARAEEALRESEERQAFLLRFADALRGEADAQAMAALALQLLADHLGLDRAYIATVFTAEDRVEVAPQLQRAGFQPVPAILRPSDFPEGFRQVEESGLVVTDIATEPTLTDLDRRSLGGINLTAFIVAAVRKGPRNLLWALVAGSAQPRAWTRAETALVREVAERTWSAVERARAEEALQRSEARLRALMTNLPGAAVFVVGPDLRYQLAEGEALYAAGFNPASLLGRTVGEALSPSLAAEHEQHYRLALAGHGFSLEHEAHGHTYISRGVPLPYATGQVTAVLVVSYDITDRKRAEKALQASEEQFRTVANLVPDLLWRSTAATGDTTWYNQQWYEYTGQTEQEAAGYGWTDVIHPDDRAASAHRYRAAIASGEFLRQEHRIRSAQGEYRWFQVQVRPVLGERGERVMWFGAATDIHARRLAELHRRQTEEHYRQQLEQQVQERTQQLQEGRDLLQSVLDTSLISMSVLYAVRDEAGQVQDFRLGLVNKELERETGRTDLVGKLYGQEYPGIRQVGIFDLMLRALATGEPQGMEYFYDFEGFKRWYSCQFVKLGDGIVATNLDITERKTAEQERLKNLRLLEQAEAVAGMGSWDYDLATGVMRWSEGMYHLVNLPLGQPVSPEVYLQLVVDDDRPRAEQLVRQLTAGQSAEETLRLRVGGQLKTVRLKAAVLRDEASRPVRVLGVDVDISELQRLEADNLRLRLTQQQALFEAVQAAQETERKRIAEGLHNGIGQILYATKLRLDLLRPPAPGANPAVEAARQEADQLLREAIRQTRALSHELVPMVLEEFGLAAALQDISQKMTTAQLQLHSSVVFDEAAAPLAPMLQMALYRMAQELAQNIAKHAHGATEASLELETTPGWVLLRAEDNGPGFALAPAQRPGLGLRSIRDQVALLGGQLESGSGPAGGAYVRIRIPLLAGPAQS